MTVFTLKIAAGAVKGDCLKCPLVTISVQAAFRILLAESQYKALNLSEP
jgi:hypothetical protein